MSETRSPSVKHSLSSLHMGCCSSSSIEKTCTESSDEVSLQHHLSPDLTENTPFDDPSCHIPDSGELGKSLAMSIFEDDDTSAEIAPSRQENPMPTLRTADVGTDTRQETGINEALKGDKKTIPEVHHLLKQDEVWLCHALFRYYASQGVSRNTLKGITGSQLLRLMRDAKIVPTYISTIEIDILFQKYRSGFTGQTVSPRRPVNTSEVDFSLGSRLSPSRRGRRALDFGSFMDICAKISLRLYPEADDIDSALSKCLERQFVDLSIRITEKGAVRKAKGTIDLSNVGQPKLLKRRRSTVGEAASAIESLLVNKTSIIPDEDESDEAKQSNEIKSILDQYEKPLKCMFKFYCTLTKVAPQKEHAIPASVIRTHINFNDTSILLKDFKVIPARLSNKKLQEVFHATKLGEHSDSKYLNWLSYKELTRLLVNISRLDAKSSSSKTKLASLLASLDHGVVNMQKRGAGQLPRFTAVEQSLV